MDTLAVVILVVLVGAALAQGICMLLYQDSLKQRLDEICE